MTVSSEQIGYSISEGFAAARAANGYNVTFEPAEIPVHFNREGLAVPLSQFALKMFVSKPPQAGAPSYIKYSFPGAYDYPAGVVMPKATIDLTNYRPQPPSTETVATASVYALEPGASTILPQDSSTVAAAHLSLASFMPNGQPRISAGALEMHASNDRYELGLPAADFNNLMVGHGVVSPQSTYMTEHGVSPEGWQVSNPTQFEQLFAVIEAPDPTATLALNALNTQTPGRVKPVVSKVVKLPKHQSPAPGNPGSMEAWIDIGW